jgi:hypothetical protein
MSEPSYGSGRSYEQQQGYGGAAGHGQQYGGPPGQPYGTGQQQPPPPYGGYGQRPGPAGYPSGGYPSAPSPSAPRTPTDRLALAATLLTVVGYVCAGAGVLGFILWLTADGDGTYRFAAALETLVVGIGLGGLNFAVGTWLAHRDSGSSR